MCFWRWISEKSFIPKLDKGTFFVNDASKVKCVTCSTIFSIKSKGKTSITKHILTFKYKNNQKLLDQNKTLEVYSTSAKNKVQNSKIIAEVSFVYHNSYISQECTINLYKTWSANQNTSSSLRCVESLF